MNPLISDFINATLNDDYGINRTAYTILSTYLYEIGEEDFLNKIKSFEDRFYITEEAAE